MQDLGQSLEQAIRFLSPKLIGKADLEKISRHTSLFPSDFSVDIFGFECSLEKKQHWADFHLDLLLTPSALKSLKQFLSQLPPSARHSSTTLQTFLEKWTSESLFSRAELSRVILEFDIGSSSFASPNLFIMADRNRSQFAERMESIYRSLKQERWPEGMLEFLHACRINGYEIFGMGVMLARQTKAVRVCMQNEQFLEITSIEKCLHLLGQIPLEHAFRLLLEKALPHLRRVSLELDIGEHLSPKIGINCFIKKGSFSEMQATWRSLLGILRSQELISRDKKMALLEWRGGQNETSLYDLFTPSSSQILYREISHIKLVGNTKQPIRAKAYLAVTRTSSNC